MRATELRKLDGELKRFLAGMLHGMGRVERREALTAYVTGLLLDGERKSIEPMAARLVDDASEIESMRQRLQQAVVVADWPDEELRRRLALKLNADLPDLEAFVVDDTGFRKKGVHSVGVSRQWSGTLGHVDNCQVAVSLPSRSNPLRDTIEMECAPAVSAFRPFPSDWRLARSAHSRVVS